MTDTLTYELETIEYEREELNAAKVRVRRGARWLDENFPGWEERIDRDTLELSNGATCICGQVFKNKKRGITGYGYATDHLFAEANSWINGIVGMRAANATKPLTDEERNERVDRVSIGLGFDAGRLPVKAAESDDVFVGIDALQRAWEDFLDTRV